MSSSTAVANVESHTEQLARLQSEVQTLRGQLAQAHRLATVGTMTAMVAHEFNNILTPIINYAQMAQTNPQLVDKALARAADGGARASDICHALLGVMRDGSSEPQQACLKTLVSSTIEAMVRKPEKDSIELLVDIPDDMQVTTRPAELQQVLLNLLINARTALLASHRARRIEVSAVAADGQVSITVADSGDGIAPDDMERIFQAFFSTGSADDDRQCHGLGLAFCRKIISDMGGDISVESTPGQGAAFTVRIPD